MPLQSHLSSLPLVRLLQEWAPMPGEPSRQDVAERLGEWLTPVGSVQLDAALQTIASYGASRRQEGHRPRGQPVDAAALDAACRHVKTGLMELIATKLAATPEADYTPHLQRYLALQKQMEAQVAACRAHVRQAMAKGSPGLRQLAALDQVMSGMLGEREQKLLAAVPVYLERRFAHWRQVHQGQRAASGLAGDDDDDPRCWPQPGGWLHGFQQDMHRMLRADLQARLQPVLGLIEAVQADNNMDRHPA